MIRQIDRFGEYAITSYRYLRIAIVVMMFSLGASVAIERANATCWQGSVSAYYYTPAHAMFIGALVTIGVCLIAIKGRTDWEDMLLNLAGALAPIVAFVPTSPPSTECTRTPLVLRDTDAFIDNNILALAIGGLVTVAVGYVIARLQGKTRIRKPRRIAMVGLGVAALLIAAGLIWYSSDRSGFNAHAHLVAAFAMFVAIGIVVVINSFRARPGYRLCYAVIAGFMAAAAVAVGVATYVNSEWRHAVFWIEALEILPFALFWGVQTLEHWDAGIEAPLPRPPAAA